MTTAEPKNKMARINREVPSSSITQVKRPHTGFPTGQGHQHQHQTDNNNINKGQRLSRKTMSTADDEKHMDDEDGNTSVSFEADDVLWAGTKRRQYKASNAAHQVVMKKAIPYFQALIISGSGGSFSSPWPEQNVAGLNILMNEAWTYVCRQLAHGHRRRPPGVDEIPEPHEARKV